MLVLISIQTFRGKTAREIYRAVKGITVTRQLIAPVSYAVASLGKERNSDYVYSIAGQAEVGELVIGYVGSLSIVRYIYKILKPSELKSTLITIYNILGVPMTLTGKVTTGWFDVFGLSNLETLWFGGPVHLINDNRLWLETNYTVAV